MNICIAREEQQLVATKKGIKIKFIQYLIIFIFCSNNEHTLLEKNWRKLKFQQIFTHGVE